VLRRAGKPSVSGALAGFLIDNWALASGRYALATGKDLRDLDARLLLEISYAMQYEMVMTLDKDHAEAIEKLDAQYDGLVFEYETGMPAIARMVAPADADDTGWSNIPPEWEQR